MSGRIGEVRPRPGELELAAGRPRIRLTVTNTSDRPVRVSSHYPFWRANRRLAFDRVAATGYRLDLPAGVEHDAVVGPEGVVCLEAHRPASGRPGLSKGPGTFPHQSGWWRR